MSNNVDNRVVQMSFDNAEFERNIRTTIKSIDALQDSLNFSASIQNLQQLDAAMKNFGKFASIEEQTEYLLALDQATKKFGTESNIESAATAIRDIGKAAEQVDISPTASAIEDIGVKLSALDAISWTVFSNIAQGLVNLGENIWNSSIGQIINGGLQRALNLEQAQFQLQGLGVDWTKVYEGYTKSLKEQVLAAVSGTAYGLDAAAKVASQLVASNIQAGSEVMQQALSGISGVAAMTNTTYEEIGSIFTTIAGNGKVMTEQVRQFSYRGLNMAATLAKYLTEVEGVITTEQGVYERLSDKDNPINAETFFKAASWAYAEQATKANETYTGSLSNVKAALSRLGAVIQTPKLEAMRKVFVSTIPVVDALTQSFTPLFDIVIDGMDFISKNAVDFLKNFAYLDDNNKLVLTGLKGLETAMKNFKTQMTELDSKGNFSAIDHLKQTFFNARDGVVALTNTFKTLLNVVFSGVKTGLFADENPYLKFAKTLSDVSKYAYKYILDIQGAITKAVTKNDALERVIAGLTSLLNIFLTLKGVVIPIAAVLLKWGTQLLGLVLQVLAPIADLITYTNRFFIITKSFVAPLKDAASSFMVLKDTIVRISNAIKNNFIAVVSPLFPNTKKHVDGYVKFSETLTAALKKVGDVAESIFGSLNTFLLDHQDSIEKVGTVVGTVVGFVIENLRKLVDYIKQNQFLSKAGQKVTEWFNAFVEGLKLFKNHVQGAMDSLGSVSTDGMDKLGAKFKKSAGPFEAVGTLLASIFNFLKSLIKSIGPLLSQAFTLISDGFSAILNVLSKGIDGLKGSNASTILAGGGIFALLIAWAQKLVTSFTGVSSLLNAGTIKSVLGSIVQYFDSIKKTYKPKIIESFADGIIKIALALLVLSSIDPVALSSGIAALSAVFAQFSAVINSIMGAGGMSIFSLDKGGINYSANSAAKFYGIAGVITAMGTAVLLISAALKTISDLNPEQLATGLAGVSAIIWELTAVAKALSSSEKSTMSGVTGLIAMAIALRIMCKAISILGDLPLANLVQGGIAVVSLIAAMSGAMVLIGRYSNSGAGVLKSAAAMIAMALAIKVIISAVSSLGGMDLMTLTTGVLGVVTLITALTAALVNLSGSKGVFAAAAAMVLVSASVVILAGAIKMLDGLSANGIIQMTVSLGILIGVIMAFAEIGKNTILKTAGAIGLMAVGLSALAVSMMLFASVQWESVAKASLVLAGIMVTLAVFSNINPIKLIASSASIVVFADAMRLLSASLMIMNLVNWGSLLKAAAAIIIVIGSVMSMAEIPVKDIIKFAGAITILGLALPLFAAGLLTFTVVPILAIVKGLLAFSIAITILSKATAVIDINKFLALAAAMALLGLGLIFFGEGLVLISAGLTALVGAVVASLGAIIGAIILFIKGIIELIPWVVKMVAAIIIAVCDVIILSAPKIIEATVVVIKTLLMSLSEITPYLGEAIRAILDTFLPILVEYIPKIVDSLITILIKIIDALADRLPELLLSIANFFKKLIGAFAEIASIELTEGSMRSFLLGLTVFSLCLVAIAAAATIAQKAMVGMLLIVGVIAVIVTAFLLLATIDTDAFLVMSTGLSAALLSISVCMAIVSAIPIAAAIQGVAGLAIFIAVLTAILGEFGVIAQIPGVKWLIAEGTSVLISIGNAIGGFVGAIVGGFMEQVSTALPAIATNLSLFMTNLGPFLDGLKQLDPKSLESVLLLTGVILALTAADIIDSFTSFLTGGVDFAHFGAQLTAFAPYIVEFADIMSQCDNGALVTAADAAAALAVFAANIPNEGGIASWFAGENSLSKWGAQLPGFAKNLVDFSNVITTNGGVDVEAIKVACEAGSAIAEMAAGLPNQGGVASWFSGENSMEIIGPQLQIFAKGLVEFNNEITKGRDIDLEKINNACAAGKAIANMAATLPNQGGVSSWFSGENSMEIIAPQLSEFGHHLYLFAHYAEMIGDIEKAQNAVKLGTAIAEMAAGLPNQGGISSWFSGDNTLSSFGEEVAKFGTKIQKFSDNVQDVDWTSTNRAIRGMEAILGLSELLDGFNKNSIIDFADAVGKLGQADVQAFLNAFKNANADCVSAANEFIRLLCKALDNNNNNSLKTCGKNMVSNVRTGINQNAYLVEYALCNAVVYAINATYDYNSDIWWIGRNFCIGIANGIYGSDYEVINAAIYVATSAINAANRALDSHSPSREGYKIGKFFDLGFANGITDYGVAVAEASKSISEDSLEYLYSVRDAVNGMEFGDPDSSIRPVVDLSMVRSGVSAISRIMNNAETYRISSTIAKERAEFNKRTNTIKVEATSKDVVEAVNKLEDRIDALGDRINHMGLYLDGKTVVGELADPLDKNLGEKANKNSIRKGVVVGRLV